MSRPESADLLTAPAVALQRPPLAGGGYRWVVCALLFCATTINYVDRGVLGVLAPDLQKAIGWTDTQYGDINAAFSLAYALGFVLFGRFIDRVGTRVGYAVALVVWSLAAAGHALARSAFGFGVARFMLGLGRRGTSRRRSRRPPNGSRAGSGRWRPACSTRGQTSGQLSPRWSYHGWRFGTAGRPPSS